MSSRAWWAVALTALAAVMVAIAVDEAAGGLGVVALVLAGSGLLHGVRDAPLRGTPAQNVGRVLIAGGAAVAVSGLVVLALLTLLLTGLCEDLCGEPRTATGLLVGAGLALGAVVVGVAACWGWRRLDVARSPEHRTPRTVAALPGIAVALVALAAGATERGDERPERPRPTGAVRVLASAPCVEVEAGDPCVAPRGLRVASASGTIVVVWRTADALRGVVVDAEGRARQIVLAGGLPVPAGRVAAADVVARPGGGFVVAWVAEPGERVRFAGVDRDGRVRAERVTVPPPGPADPAPASPDPAPASPDPATPTGDRVAPDLALAATPTGFVLFAVDRPRADPVGSGRRLRAFPLDPRLRPRGDWRTARSSVPNGLTSAAATPDGGGAVTVGRGGVRTTVTVDRGALRPRTATERLLVPGPRGATAERLPAARGIPSTRYRPRVLDAFRDGGGRLRSLFDTDAAPGDDGLSRSEQQWLLGPGPGTPDRPLADGLVDARLARAIGNVVVVGLRPRSAFRDATVDIVRVRPR